MLSLILKLFTVFVLTFAKDDLYGKTKPLRRVHQLLVDYQLECKCYHLSDNSKYIKSEFHHDR